MTLYSFPATQEPRLAHTAVTVAQAVAAFQQRFDCLPAAARVSASNSGLRPALEQQGIRAEARAGLCRWDLYLADRSHLIDAARGPQQPQAKAFSAPGGVGDTPRVAVFPGLAGGPSSRTLRRRRARAGQARPRGRPRKQLQEGSV